MLAHEQAALLNASRLAASLMISAQTVTRYIDLLLVRRLRPFHIDVGKRLVRSPKVYVRDSGIVHAPLGIGDYNALSGHPVAGASWEGFVIETSLPLRLAAPCPASIAPQRAERSISFWRLRDTAAGLSTSNEAGRRSPRRAFV
jgi:predicted AAA+ superfamily ATPase